MNANQDTLDRTGPLHRVLGVTASASQDEVIAVAEQVDPSDPAAGLAASLVDPEIRQSYEELVLASNRGERIRVLADGLEGVRQFAMQVGFQLHSVAGDPEMFDVRPLQDNNDPVSSYERPAKRATGSVSILSKQAEFIESCPESVTTSTGVVSIFANVAHALRTSLLAQIVAGILIIGLLSAVAWTFTPRPVPPTPEELNASEARVLIKKAGNALGTLREKRHSLDSEASQRIGAAHVWHDVDTEPPPTVVAEWIAKRDNGDRRALISYNRIAAFRKQLNQLISDFEARHSALSARLSTEVSEATLEKANALLQDIKSVTTAAAQKAAELQRLDAGG